jgi:uncharacterized damage-inducible protein DinB
MISKEEMLSSLDESHQIMGAVLRDLQSARASSGEIYPTWTIKEMLAHLTGWDASSTETLNAYAQGRTPQTPAAADRGFVRFNAGNIQERENLSLEQMVQAWEESREAFKQAIRDLPDEKVNQPFTSSWGQPVKLDEFVQIFAEHEIEHAHEIREKLLPPDDGHQN